MSWKQSFWSVLLGSYLLFFVVLQTNAVTIENNNLVGSIPWTKISNVETSNNIRSSITLASGEISNYIYVRDFNLAIPEKATINGIKVTVERLCPNVYPGKHVEDFRIMLHNDTDTGYFVGENKADYSQWTCVTPPRGTDSTVYYGSETDIWGYPWTPDIINDPYFGIGYSVWAFDSGYGAIANVDYVTLQVYFTEPSINPIWSWLLPQIAYASTTCEISDTHATCTDPVITEVNPTQDLFAGLLLTCLTIVCVLWFMSHHDKERG